MKTSYLPKSKSKKLNLRKAVFLSGVFLVSLVVFPLLDSVILTALTPFWKTENAAARFWKKEFQVFRSRQALLEENAALRERLNSLELQLSELASKEEQTEFLSSVLNRKKSESSIVVSVLTRPPQSPYDILVIDAGSQDGILLNASAYLPAGSEIGRVSEVFSKTAKVRLLTSSGEITSAVLERTNEPVELEGVGSGNFKIIVSRDTQVEIGDRIISASLPSSILAVVGDIEDGATDSFKKVLAKSPANIFGIQFLLIK